MVAQVQTSSFKLSDATESFILNLKVNNRSGGTVRWYDDIFQMFKSYCLTQGVYDLDQISASLIRNFLLFLKEERDNPNSKKKGLSQSTVAGYFAALRSFFNYLVAEKWMVESPMASMQGLKRPRDKVEPFTTQEFQQFLNTIKKASFVGLRDYTLFWLLYDTGLRINEALTLRQEDINLIGMFLKVVGKGNKERVVPFGLTTRKVLHKYIDQVKRRERLTDRIFISRSGLPLGYRQVQRAMARYGRKAKIERVRCSPHTLRHTFAIEYLCNGGDQFSLQDILGHSDPSTTAIYVKFSQERLRQRGQLCSPGDMLIRKSN